MNQQEINIWTKAVGLTFNPSGEEDNVTKAKTVNGGSY